MKTYRTHEAQQLHHALMTYIDTAQEEAFSGFIGALEATSEQDLSILSINGHTHFMDALHLPFERQISFSISSQISLRLCGAIKARVSKFPRLWGFFLTQEDKEGFSPLLQVLKSGSADLAEFYFNALRDWMKAPNLSRIKLVSLLLQTNKAGYTPIQQVLKDGHTVAIHLCLKLIAESYRSGMLTLQEYEELMLHENQEGFTPLHQVLVNGNTEHLKLYLKAIREVKSYPKLLIATNKAGFSALHSAVVKGNTYNLKMYIEEIYHAIAEGWLGFGDYKALLISKNTHGFSLFQSLLIKGNTLNLRLYLEELNRLRAIEISKGSYALSQEDFISVLIGQNEDGFTPMHDALASEPSTFVIYLRTLKACLEHGLSVKDYAHLFLATNKAGFSPLHSVLEKRQHENFFIYLEEIKQLVNAKVISKQNYVKLLMGANNSGFTPFHEALLTGADDIVELYFAELKDCQEKEWITKKDYTQFLTKPNRAGFTPLHHVLMKGSLECIKRYCEILKISLSTEEYQRCLLIPTSYKGYTPLHQAACFAHFTVVEWFIEECERHLPPEGMATLLFASSQEEKSPYCPDHKYNARKVNSFLEEKRNVYRAYSLKEEGFEIVVRRKSHGFFCSKHLPIQARSITNLLRE